MRTRQRLPVGPLPRAGEVGRRNVTVPAPGRDGGSTGEPKDAPRSHSPAGQLPHSGVGDRVAVLTPAELTTTTSPTRDGGPTGEPEDAPHSRAPMLPLSHSQAAAQNREDRTGTADARHLWDALKDVMDPELPLSIVDLGLVCAVHAAAGVVEVDLTYTATGCPCMEFIHDDVRARLLREPDVAEVRIRDVWHPPWTPARISPEGRAALRRRGVAA